MKDNRTGDGTKYAEQEDDSQGLYNKGNAGGGSIPSIILTAPPLHRRGAAVGPSCGWVEAGSPGQQQLGTCWLQSVLILVTLDFETSIIQTSMIHQQMEVERRGHNKPPSNISAPLPAGWRPGWLTACLAGGLREECLSEQMFVSVTSPPEEEGWRAGYKLNGFVL
ncbi:hypothetical protein EYF80_031650 [Liparis tanakae]|uniref:Uncharacterized protein n=1 Tax=Liparis tanakae TaxID=230148 RepID=A0A4Z2GWV3_9TELE|nr:hypothetical protein EYF80_031650 [Liparis tanakae]